jgi:glycosyltransferase involved in cell wall biosynthesis
VGFACLWDRDPARTWSSTPWALRDELVRRLPIVDLGANPGWLTRSALRSSAARRTRNGWKTLWRSSALTDVVVGRLLEREVKRQKPAVALQVLDLAHLSCPYFVLRDTSWAQLRELHAGGLSFELLGHPGFTTRRLDRRAARERSILAGAVGVIATSDWMRRGLLADGVPADRVHVISLGATSVPTLDARVQAAVAERIVRPRHRLLFVGRDFRRKGGDLVVEAFSRLRRHRPELTLTVVGPATWPLDGPVPDGVDFRGALEFGEVAELYTSHDLFVLPSRFEAFGIVFVEAQSVGLPCIGRDRCAMPELVREGVNGSLVRSEDPAELAARIETVLDDDELYRRCAADIPLVRQRHSWASAAERIEALLAPFLG